MDSVMRANSSITLAVEGGVEIGVADGRLIESWRVEA